MIKIKGIYKTKDHHPIHEYFQKCTTKFKAHHHLLVVLLLYSNFSDPVHTSKATAGDLHIIQVNYY